MESDHKNATIAKSLFGENISEMKNAEMQLDKILQSNEVIFGRLGWDDYDGSLELYGVPNDYRLTENTQRDICDAGFIKVYVNHIDKWETHYSFNKKLKFGNGWRVCYPHKRGEENGSIWVECMPEFWPKDWLVSGHVIVKKVTENN